MRTKCSIHSHIEFLCGVSLGKSLSANAACFVSSPPPPASPTSLLSSLGNTSVINHWYINKSLLQGVLLETPSSHCLLNRKVYEEIPGLRRGIWQGVSQKGGLTYYHPNMILRKTIKAFCLSIWLPLNIGDTNMSDLFCKLWALADSLYPVTPEKRHVQLRPSSPPPKSPRILNATRSLWSWGRWVQICQMLTWRIHCLGGVHRLLVASTYCQTQAGQRVGSECFHFGLLLKQKASSTRDIHKIRI